MSPPKTSRASLSIAAVLVAAVPLGGIASADDIATGAVPAVRLEPGAGEGTFRHLQALQDIASANGGNRAAGTPGYDRSAEYVAERLKEAGYAVRFEEFEFPFFEDRAPPVLVVSEPGGEASGAVRTLTNSGSGDLTGRLRAVNLQLGAGPPAASTSGCEAADFDGFERGAVALIRRGTCPFQTKVEHAAAAGAAGVVIMNEGTNGRTDVFSGLLSKPAAIPVVGISYERGRSLDTASRTDGGAIVRLAVDALAGKRATRNVLAEAEPAGSGPLIVVGAHLDSVPEGPGINDNGSGSAAVLEAALRLAHELAETRARVRFAFWGAEERGLVGSRHHVAALSEEERRNIAVYINLDMVGSPNFVRYVQESTKESGQQSGQKSAAAGDGLAATARREFLADFREHDLTIEERSGGRFGTDTGSFSEKGIPTVGLYTGAGGPKSEAQANTFGGTAGRPYDPCYHQACDTVENINREVLEENTRALMRALSAVAIVRPVPGPPARKAEDGPEPRP
jgi:Zn-dependent M28 family amino/carboxypeptidase